MGYMFAFQFFECSFFVPTHFFLAPMLNAMCCSIVVPSRDVRFQLPANDVVLVLTPTTSDMFALGIIFYIIMLGCHPFDPLGQCTDHELRQNIIHGRYNWQDDDKNETTWWWTVAKSAGLLPRENACFILAESSSIACMTWLLSNP